MKNFGLILLLAAIAVAQVRPSFDVASVKPSADATNAYSGGHSGEGKLTLNNVSLRRCIRGAYGIAEPQVIGGPRWVDDERWDISAKADHPAGDSEISLMFQSLLAERFKLAVHNETRDLRGYALVLAKGGLKVASSAEGTPYTTSSGRTTVDVTGCTLSEFAIRLSNSLGYPILDMTQTKGTYDIHLKWTPETNADSGTTIFAVLQDIGLKLEARKVPTQVLVIDSVEHPAAN